ncbi:MAG: isoprenyl transferase [Varibaculum sp.]|nr:isoprenyl transferase [Varibaculum sp.]
MTQSPEQVAPPADLVKVPEHIAVIMDGNGRWATARGLERTEGHKRGEEALMDTVAGAVAAGVKYVSMYAFSTENWRRSPSEVHFLMGYSRRVIRERAAELNSWNVRIRWSGRSPKLWKSVIKELRAAEELTHDNTGTQLILCVNYGGRAEIADAASALAADVRSGRVRSANISERTFSKYLYLPDIPDVDLLIRTSREQRLSNFLLWQCAYAEFVFSEKLWPEYTRQQLWRDLMRYGSRERRFGSA